MQLSAIDMNLLVALDALLTEGSVSRAAARVGLSPSAMSHALARLRALLDDPLLVRSRRGLSPTPRAKALQPELRNALETIRLALIASPDFDPSSSALTFSVSCQDITQIMLLPRLLSALEREAPNVRLDVWPLASQHEIEERLERGTMDLVVEQLTQLPSQIHTELLLEDRVICLVRENHPRIGKKLTREQDANEGHLGIAAASHLKLPFSLDRLLEHQGIQRRVVASVRSLVAAPAVVANTDLICTSSEVIGAPLAEALGVRVMDLPIQVPPPARPPRVAPGGRRGSGPRLVPRPRETLHPRRIAPSLHPVQRYTCDICTS